MLFDAIIRRTTPQFRGDFQKFAPQHIQAVPILDRLVEDAVFSSSLADLGTRVLSARAQGQEAAALSFETEIDAQIQSAAGDRGIILEI